MAENVLSESDMNSNDTIGFEANSMEYLSQESGESPLPDNIDVQRSRGGRFSMRERPFACHVCNKRFTQKAHLIIHKRIHTGEKPYACHICHKRFAQSSHLTVHKRVHTGEKPFFCNFCGMGFCRRPRLEAHVLQHVVKEGRQLPSGLKGDMMSGLSMVGLGSAVTASKPDGTNPDTLDAANQMRELQMKGGLAPEIKSEPIDIDDDDVVSSMIADVSCGDKPGDNDAGRKRRKPEFVRRFGNKDGDEENTVDADVSILEINNKKSGKTDYANSSNNMLGLSSDELEKFTSGLTELSDLQRQALSHNLMIGTSKNQLNNFINNNIINNSSNNNQRMHSSSMMMSPSLTMSGMVRTNSRISLVDFTAEDILQHLMTRDDVKSCDFCCIVFHDPAMYYLHRSMHDKMDVRCCNLCGKQLADKYDFTAHFLSQHK